MRSKALHLLATVVLGLSAILISMGILGYVNSFPVQALGQDEVGENAFFLPTNVTALVSSTAYNSRIYGVMQAQVVITMPNLNTVTVKAYHSNDNNHWIVGETLVSGAIVSSTNVIVQVPITGTYTKIGVSSLGNSAALSIEVRSLFKPTTH